MEISPQWTGDGCIGTETIECPFRIPVSVGKPLPESRRIRPPAVMAVKRNAPEAGSGRVNRGWGLGAKEGHIGKGITGRPPATPFP